MINSRRERQEREGLHEPQGRQELYDGLFLAVVIALSCVLYVPYLGLYSDDWAFLAHMHLADGESFGAIFQAVLADGLRPRPVQALNLALLYRAFGLEPLGYHVTNSLVLVATVVLFHRVLRGIGLSRELSVAIPLVFGLLPHYSTDRFWIAAFQANISILALFGSLHFDLRFARGTGAGRWSWKLLGTLALLASVLAYEMTGPLFLLTPFLVWYGVRRRVERPGDQRWGPLPILLAANVASVALAVAYKSAFTQRTGLEGLFLWRLKTTVIEATSVGFGSYGVALPVTVGRAVRDHFDPSVLVLSLAVGACVWAYLTFRMPREGRQFPRPPTWLGVMLAGAVVFAAGYAVALVTLEVGFDTTGMNNRTAIAPALGVACVFVAAAGLLSSFFPREGYRWGAFRIFLTLLAFSGVLLVNTIATFWIAAAREQEPIIAGLRAELPDLPAGSTVLLDGVCPYIGPGTVFETVWDVTGLVRIVYGDKTLRGDVIKPNSVIGDEGIRTILYDDVIFDYSYGPELKVFQPGSPGGRGVVHSLATAADARQVLRSPEDWACPPGEEGYGVRIF